MIVLGLSGLPHSQPHHLRSRPGIAEVDSRICQGMDSAACLVVDGNIVAAAAEERFTGDKATGAFPEKAIAYCLDHAGITGDDVDLIAHGFNYDRFRRFFHRTPEYFDEVLSGRTVVEELARTGWRNPGDRFRPVDHHVAHAASAYHLSGYEDALSVVSDGMGETVALTVHRFTRGRMEELYSQGIDSSLGILYSILTRYLGYTFNSDEYKVMGLSAYGDPRRYAEFFARFMGADEGRAAIGWPQGALGRAGEGYPDALAFLEESLGVAPREPGAEVPDEYADIAAAFQARFSEVLTDLVRHWLRHTGQDSLCLSGGTFLNCLANQSISELPEVSRMFVPPAAGDDGTAMGAALHVAGGFSGTFSAYTGPGYGADDVRSALKAFERPGGGSPVWEYHGFTDEYMDLAARDLAEDRVVAWFAGRMEFGPRALGNRSILALPNGDDIKGRLNAIVKMREGFRPFAPAILDSDYEEVFEGRALSPSRYMLSTARTRPERIPSIRGAVHVDGTARVQIVTKEDNEVFWRLLHKVKEHTGLGCVINTSFNVKNQPIIASPDLALEALERMSLGRLYIEGFRVGLGG
ncbi:carbamoyltransferase C-terminal domain-containing protein [Nocardiopsis sp. NPDC006198]|uniref:carbamoyltransferase family protein n=1 Tax=Nocardiopsis sp. NPDC006198 TaxID=3154472 RepID=UPI0033B378DC